MNLLCLLGRHSRVQIPPTGLFEPLRYGCRRCPGRWHYDSGHSYGWGYVPGDGYVRDIDGPGPLTARLEDQ